MKNNLQRISIVLFLTLLVFSLSIQAQDRTFDIASANRKASIENYHEGGLDLNATFHIGLDINKLKNLQPKEESRDNTYYFPDTVVVYSVSENPIRYTYFYSDEGYLQMRITKKLQNDVWENQSYIISTFDSVGNALTTETKVWQNGAWVHSIKTTSTYTTNHNVLTSLYEFWDGNVWVGVNRDTFTYNASGNVVAYLAEESQDNAWSNVSYALYSYDEFGNLISGIQQIWEIDTWNNNVQFTYTYDANNNLTYGLIENWAVDIWENAYNESFIYDANNQPIEYTGQVWTEGVWLNETKYNYTYNDYGFVTTAVGQLWDNGQWVNYYRGQFTQNFYGGTQSALIEQWISDAWVNVSLSTYSHDEFGNTLNATLYFWDGSTWAINQDGLLEMSYYYNLYSEYFVGYWADASYKTIVTAIQNPIEFNTNLFTASPNPTNGPLNFNILMNTETNVDISLFNSNGAKVLAVYSGLMPKGENKLNMNSMSLPSGVYIATLSTSTIHKFLKIIVTK